MAVFNETLRMFPPVSIPYIQDEFHCLTSYQATAIYKTAAEDTSLVTSNIHGEKCTVPIPKGVEIAISVPGLHYNRKAAYFHFCALSLYRTLARYWEDPYAFRPSRFLKDWPRDAFLPFSAGNIFPSVVGCPVTDSRNLQVPMHASAGSSLASSTVSNPF